MFLVTRTETEFWLVYNKDPALADSDSDADPAWIPADKAKMKTGKSKADRIKARALNSDEIVRIAALEDAAFPIYTAALGVVEIEMGSGKTLKESEEIHEVLNHPGNIAAVSALASAIFQASSEGLASLGFR